MATGVWFLELAQKDHTLSWVRGSSSKGAPKRLSLLFLHMSFRQRACPVEVPTDDGNTSAAIGLQLHLSPLKPKICKTKYRWVRASRMQACLVLYFSKTNHGKVILWQDRSYLVPSLWSDDNVAVDRAAFWARTSGWPWIMGCQQQYAV